MKRLGGENVTTDTHRTPSHQSHTSDCHYIALWRHHSDTPLNHMPKKCVKKFKHSICYGFYTNKWYLHLMDRWTMNNLSTWWHCAVLRTFFFTYVVFNGRPVSPLTASFLWRHWSSVGGLQGAVHMFSVWDDVFLLQLLQWMTTRL